MADNDDLADRIAKELKSRNFFGWLLANASNPIWKDRTPEQEIGRVVADLAGDLHPLLEVDGDGGAWYIRLLDEDVARTTEPYSLVNVDWTADGRMIGIEILAAQAPDRDLRNTPDTGQAARDERDLRARVQAVRDSYAEADPDGAMYPLWSDINAALATLAPVTPDTGQPRLVRHLRSGGIAVVLRKYGEGRWQVDAGDGEQYAEAPAWEPWEPAVQAPAASSTARCPGCGGDAPTVDGVFLRHTTCCGDTEGCSWSGCTVPEAPAASEQPKPGDTVTVTWDNGHESEDTVRPSGYYTGANSVERGEATVKVVRSAKIEQANSKLLQVSPSLGVGDPAVSEQPSDSLTVMIHRQRAWSRNTFGPGDRLYGILDHIRKELNEIEAAPRDVSEWIDVVILALDGAWRAGIEPEEIVTALLAKYERNRARQWPDWRTAPEGQAIEHVRPAASDLLFSSDAEEDERLQIQTLQAAQTIVNGGKVGSVSTVVGNLLAMYQELARPAASGDTPEEDRA